MKKSSFVAMVMGTIGGILTSIGMCMCLLPEWNAFTPGVVIGSCGLVVLLAMTLIWRKMEGKAPIILNAKTIGRTLFGILGTAVFGIGMCFTMVWGNMVLGIIIGIIGIVMLLSLIPIVKGFKEVRHE